jgi:hypothetical protein
MFIEYLVFNNVCLEPVLEKSTCKQRVTVKQSMGNMVGPKQETYMLLIKEMCLAFF